MNGQKQSERGFHSEGHSTLVEIREVHSIARGSVRRWRLWLRVNRNQAPPNQLPHK